MRGIIWGQIVGQSILGGERYFSSVKGKYINNGKGSNGIFRKDREGPDIRKNHQYLSMIAVLAVVQKETGMSQVLLSPGTTRQVVMTVLYNFTGLTNWEIGRYYGGRLAKDPFLGKELQAELSRFRSFRFMRYRIVYAVDTESKYLVVWAIGHRRDIYETMSDNILSF